MRPPRIHLKASGRSIRSRTSLLPSPLVSWFDMASWGDTAQQGLGGAKHMCSQDASSFAFLFSDDEAEEAIAI